MLKLVLIGKYLGFGKQYHLNHQCKVLAKRISIGLFHNPEEALLYIQMEITQLFTTYRMRNKSDSFFYSVICPELKSK